MLVIKCGSCEMLLAVNYIQKHDSVNSEILAEGTSEVYFIHLHFVPGAFMQIYAFKQSFMKIVLIQALNVNSVRCRFTTSNICVGHEKDCLN